MSPAALSESGRHQPPPGRPRLLVTRARGPATRSAFLGLPTTHRALVRWEKHVLRHLGLAGGGSLLGRPARPHRGHFSRPLDSGASLTIGSTRLDTLKKWGRPTQTARWAECLPHHRMSAHTKSEAQRGPVAATRADRRVPDHSPGHAERTSVRGGAKNGFTWGVGCTGDAKSWTCGRPCAEFSTRKSDQTTALARSRGPLGTISMLLEGLRAAHSPGTVFGWRTRFL